MPTFLEVLNFFKESMGILIGLAGLFISCATLQVAYKALATWKEQKHYDVYVEASAAFDAYAGHILKGLTGYMAILSDGGGITLLNRSKRLDSAVDTLMGSLHEKDFFKHRARLKLASSEEHVKELYARYEKLLDIIHPIHILTAKYSVDIELNSRQSAEYKDKMTELYDMCEEAFLKILKSNKSD